MKQTSFIVGAIGAVFSIGYGAFLCYGYFSGIYADIIILMILGYVLVASGLLGLVFSDLSRKKKGACVGLIILGVPSLMWLSGIFYIIAGRIGLKNLKKAAAQAAVEAAEPVREESREIQAEAAPVQEAAVGNTVLPKEEEYGEIDISREERPKGRRFGGKWFPSKGWFADNGIPVKEIPVDKRTLKSMSDEQKYVVALSTFSIVKIKAIFIIVTFITCLVIGFVASAKSGSDNEVWGYAFTVLIMLFGVGFIVVKPTKLIDGFKIVNGSFKDRIGLPWYWDLIFFVAWTIGTFWSMFASTILILFDMTRREKMLSIPRVGVPQNIGMDDMIDVYSAYERACSVDDAFNQASAAAAKREYDRKQNELDSIKTSTASSGLSASDKQAIINKAGEVQKENEKIYNDRIKPNL